MRHRNTRARVLLSAGLAATLAACGSVSEEAASYDSADYEMKEEAAEAVADAAAEDGAGAAAPRAEITVGESAPQQVSTPKIAYVYDYGFRIEPDEIATLAQAHIDLCEKMPDNGCRVVNLRQSGSEGSYANGRLELAVAAGKARAFGKDLGATAEGLGGEQIDVGISGEDLSKQMVDTEARLRARILLRDRLMEVLRSRSGTVAELVEAERGVAQVNEEIDQARSWLTEMRGRVAFSKVSIDYSSSARSGGSFGRPIVEAFQSMGTVMGMTIAVLLYGLAIAIPLLILIFGLRWVLHRFGMQMRFWRNSKKDEASGDKAEE